MARNLSANSLAKLAERLGTEPIVVVEVSWSGDSRVAYADRDIPEGNVKGAIQSLSDLDDVVQVSGGSQSQQISITLSDADGSLKEIIDSIDIHKRPVWVYQWFDGIPLSDKFLIFRGAINSPINWDEGDRTLTFDVISQIEDVEVGFSIEEGDFVNPPEELIGKPWPLCFGTVLNVPALKTQAIRRGILGQGVGIRDFTLERRLALANQIVCPQNFQGYSVKGKFGTEQIVVSPIYEDDPACKKSKCEAIEWLTLQLQEQSAYEYTELRIYGGETFPQNERITLNINGGLFQGLMNGEIFTIIARQHPKNDGSNNIILDDTTTTIQSKCGTNTPPAEDIEDDGAAGVDATLLAVKSKQTWAAYNDVQAAGFFWANAGSVVTLHDDEEMLYIVNLLPSTILRVAAYREISGISQLVTVPSDYYTVRQTDYTGYSGVMEIVFPKPLSQRDLDNGGGWSDDIYVSMTSSVGPNTVDILEWFIETYTPYSVDATSFSEARSTLENYPMHFPLLTRKNIMAVLQEIAFQARCALWLKDDVFYIKYLAAEPESVGTITEDDVLPNTLRVVHTSTEDLVTKYVARWRKDYAVDQANTLILRHNVKKYGTHEEEYEFYCFNILDLVRKAATFWLIRRSNTWRLAQFETPITKLNLETFDTAMLTLPDVADDSIKGMVEKADYNSLTHTIAFSVWTPCKAGTRSPYMFAWPADVDEMALFPTIEERDLGLAGSGNEPNFSVIAPNGHPLSSQYSNLIQGFQLACNGAASASYIDACRPDHGDRFPSDRGDTKPTPSVFEDQTGSIHVGTSPITSDAFERDCCDLAAQALQEAQQARREAQEALQAAASNSGESTGSLDDLPAECGGACTVWVKIQYIRVKSVAQQPPMEPPISEFGSGRPAESSLGRSECYTFNSRQAAANFYNEMVRKAQDKWDRWGYSAGNTEAYIATDVTTNAAIGFIDENGAACTELPEDEWAMVGYVEYDPP